MPLQRHRRLWIVVLTLLGTVLGTASGYWLGRATLLRSANSGLSDYAADLAHHADQYAVELSTIQKTFNPSKYAFCSREEIAEMQTMTFRSLQVKEIGRTHAGKFYCSAFLGRLDPPKDMPHLTMTLPNGAQVYNDVVLTFAGRAHGTILEFGDVDVVLSPNAFDHWDRPHLRYMVAIVNSATRQMTTIAGEPMDVGLDWIIGQGAKQVAGELYRAHCSLERDVCVVTAESTSDVLGNNRPMLVEYAVLGGLAGFGLGLAIAQFFLQQLGIAQQFRRALRNEALQLVYQPILELPSRACAGAEVLTRWSDADGRAIAPDVFVRIAEERGFIGELTSFVIRRSLEEVGEILRKNPELTLSINIAASDLEGDTLFELLEKHLRQARIQPRQIALELTERSTAKLAILREAVLRLHREGYQIHIDDFGTGFSSLAYLHELHVDAIKIDRSFTQTIGTDAVTASILPQILELAATLQVEVIVEGVETEEQASYLVSTGRRMQAQGWYFGKPVVACDLPKYREQTMAMSSAITTEHSRSLAR